MHFSQTAEYALRAVVFLASVKGEPRTSAQIARATQVPANYLSKLMMALRKSGMVTAQRGVGGGFVLARPAAGISVWEVIKLVDPMPRITSCPLKLEIHGSRLCPMHRKLDDAMGLIERTLKETSIQGLLDEPSSSRPMGLPMMAQ